ncbi:MAG: glycosyltransferase family 1 protein [Candidatus Thermofonsia Clade 3 bacterium]|uniref:Glycosyltransferase family 1 protein n=1 Tax=Candidatus Thermofonsia Clade 3 bacterium TaxID=2364212 RepID=A0A2M8Q9X2_9CHLR|nr:glycosyltransferase family 1 protein [Candidatus Roseilinea sp. NK_OTU-006]PJF46609.1 MAG: glycosyltransferase family 1 protein [Candidatus Thermofonsia Clade 3 bacterium]
MILGIRRRAFAVARITIDYTPAIHQDAGIARLTREVVRAVLASGAPHEFRLFVMGRPAPGVPLSNLMNTRELPLHVSRMSDRWLYRLWFRANVRAPVQLFSGPCDLYHATDFVLPPLRDGTPSVLTVHDLSFERDPDSAPPRLIPFLKRVVPDSARRATHIVADSHATARDLTALYGVPPEKITVIHSGVDGRFTPYRDTLYMQRRRAYVLKKYGIGDAPFILTVGTLQRRKNHLRLVQAFAKLIAARSGARTPLLVIAGGKGWLYDEVHAEVQRLGLGERVRFIGYVEDMDLPHLYRAAAAFAFPSTYEGFGLPPLEAMASGVPVVTSNVSSLPEVVGEAGLQVDPLDVDALARALEQALNDEVWRRHCIARGLARAAQFTWQRAAEQLLAVYERVLRQ